MTQTSPEDKLIGHTQDEYTQPADGQQAPPRTFRETLRHLGPSIIISGAIVGSGEIILTASLGAAVGFAMLWWLLFSCWSKSIVQAELTRYVVLSGDTYLRALNRIPGKTPGPKGPFAWPLAFGLVGYFASLTGLGGLIGGSGQAIALLIPDLDARVAVAALAVLASILLGSGSYRRLEKLMLVLVLTFTVLTIIGVLLMQGTAFAMSPSDVANGLRFEFSTAFAVLALATYGFTGVNAGEITAYTYWCIEKGYPARIGRFDNTAEWFQRAHGWLRVLRTDVWVTLIILTFATVPFYFLGAGVLHAMGEQPQGKQVLLALSNMYTQTLGSWSLWLFGVGAFCILYSSTLASVASGARYLPDYLVEFGFMRRERVDLRRAIIRWYCVVTPFIGLGLYVGFQRPVLMVTIAACYYALMLPLQSAITIYLHAKRLPAQVQPKWPARYFLRVIFVLQLALAVAVIRFTVF